MLEQALLLGLLFPRVVLLLTGLAELLDRANFHVFFQVLARFVQVLQVVVQVRVVLAVAREKADAAHASSHIVLVPKRKQY